MEKKKKGEEKKNMKPVHLCFLLLLFFPQEVQGTLVFDSVDYELVFSYSSFLCTIYCVCVWGGGGMAKGGTGQNPDSHFLAAEFPFKQVSNHTVSSTVLL